MDASRQPSPLRRMAALLGVLTVAASLLMTAPGPLAQGDPPPNPSNGQINTAKAKKAALADQVGKLSAQLADLQQQVANLQAKAELAEQKLADALQKLAEAKAAASAARERLSAAQAEVDKATQQFSDFVRASYMGSPINGTAAGLLTAPDPNALLVRNDYLSYSADHRLDIVGNLSKAKVTQSNADASARGAEQRQTAATDAAAQARQEAQDALSAARAAQHQMSAKLSTTQSALNTARLQLATLNNQRARYIAWQQEQARIAAARAAAEARARAAAAATPASTSGSRSRRASSRKRSRSRVSMETFTRFSPACTSSGATPTSPMPFVVSDNSGRGRNAARRATTAGRVGCSRGSPPVSRMLVTPRDTNAPASRTISSSVSSSDLRSHGKPSAGMQ